MEYRKLPHIIHRQVLDLHLPSNRFDGNIEGQIKNLCYEALPEIDRVFSLYDEPGQITRINKVFLDLGRFDVDKLDELFLSRFRQALIETLDKIKLGNKDATGSREANGINYEPVSIKDLSGIESVLHSIDDIKRSSTEEGMREAFLYYLDNGVYPWWIGGDIEEDAEEIFAHVLDQPSNSFIRQTKELFRHSNHALTRLIYQFPGVFIERIIHLLNQESREEISAMYETVQRRYPVSFKAIGTKKDESDEFIIRLLLRLLLAEDPVMGAGVCVAYLERGIKQGFVIPENMQQLLADAPFIAYNDQLKELTERSTTLNNKVGRPSDEAALPEAKKQTEVTSTTRKDEKKDLVEDKSDESIDKFIYVGDAGLVLLHSFLNEFFFSLGLLDVQRRFADEGAQTRAVYLLSFLATGRSNPPEHTVPFCKFLCGLPLKIAIIKEIELSKYEMEECEQLLHAVIGHWSALKSTSIDGLREGFLQRKGKLDFRESMTALFVETKAQDVLLETMPWGISYIQLPWLTKPFTTTWN